MVVDSTLREAALCGDEDTFRRLVHCGEDANTVVGALLLGATSLDELDAYRAQSSASGRLAILSFLLETRSLSLYTLNASHSSLKGLTPLGMAAYLNRLDFVTLLLEKGDGLVLVDGLDSQRATPIMYAARDGHTEIVQYLIRHGARTSSVDCYYRSVLFYAVSAPQCLWSCELNLRLERARSLLSHSRKRKLKLSLQCNAGEYNSLACMYQRHPTYPLSPDDLRPRVKRLVTSITSADVSAVHSLLFPQHTSQSPTLPSPVLVNHSDENGWSPIHYCVTSPRPSTAILDALYLAGADLALYTADNSMTPLHALARFGGNNEGASFRLYAFIVHLIRDLGAPLDAVDHNGETCIHVAARYGRCTDVLMAFLESDADGVAAKIANNEGLTAYEVTKPEFRSAFEQDDGSIRPDSAASLRTIRPSYSSSSLATSHSSSSSDSSDSLEDELMQYDQFPRPISREKENLRLDLLNPGEAQQLIDDLAYVSGQLEALKSRESASAYSQVVAAVDLDDVENLLQSTCQSGSELLERFRQLIDAELDDLHAAQDVHGLLEQLIERLERRALADEEEDTRSKTPSPSFLRRLSETPSLVTSGSSSALSLTSLADLDALITPTGSPRMSTEIQTTPRADSVRGKKNAPEESEVDFGCALATGSFTRNRRPSALSAIFAIGTDSAFRYTDPNCPLEEGVNLVSYSPVRAPEVQDVAVHLHTPGSPTGGGRVGHESWLNPYVRRANSDILKEHLANLLEIEKMLFGKEDREREQAPSPGSVCDEMDEACWREGIEAIQEEDGTFLEMFDGDESESSADEDDRNDDEQFLDLFVSSESVEDTVKFPTIEISPSKERTTAGYPLSALDILRITRHELSSVEEIMTTACRSIETAQHYISQAERLTSNIFRELEHAVQATRLTSALNDLCAGEIDAEQERGRSGTPDSMLYVPPPTSSPVTQRMPAYTTNAVSTSTSTESCAFPLPPPSSRYLQEKDRKPSIQSLVSLASPSPMQSPAATVASSDDMRALRRVLVRKIPVWLDATAYDVDKASTWVGVVQAVVHNVRRTRL